MVILIRHVKCITNCDPKTAPYISTQASTFELQLSHIFRVNSYSSNLIVNNVPDTGLRFDVWDLTNVLFVVQ